MKPVNIETVDINNTIINSLPFISHLSESDKKLLFDSILIKDIDLSATTMSPNSCDGLIIVDYGKLRVFMTSQGGKEITLYHLTPSDVCVLSYRCQIGSMPFNLEVKAVEKSRVFNIPSTTLNKLLELYPSIKEFLLNETTSRLADVMSVVEKVAFSSLDTRLIELLLEQKSSVIYRTHAELASDLGTSREIISRLLKNFENDGLIKLSRGKIKLLDVDTLNKLALK